VALLVPVDSWRPGWPVGKGGPGRNIVMGEIQRNICDAEVKALLEKYAIKAVEYVTFMLVSARYIPKRKE
jgi:hypothetical protein